MLLSIISGTYNRISHLKAFIESCRQQIPPYWEYEFVITDGKSTDGTIEYLEAQSDVVLIKHDGLLGAIKAFNDAASMAKGDYLLVGNDDVTIQSGSIVKALSYMISRPDLGGGCFYQDRCGKPHHVEYMNVMRDGQPIQIPYVQVGIIPRWLWNHCGGWGNFGALTYGGDNYVSAKILEAGYGIEAIEGTMIHDSTPYDELRKTNNEVNEGGADGRKFYDTFPNGFEYNRKPQVENPLKFKKILYAPIIEGGYPEAKKQKTGLRNALSKIGVVLECDYFSGESLSRYAKVWQPDMVVTQIHNCDEEMLREVIQVRENCNGFMVNWNGDTYKSQQETPLYLQMLQYFDLQTGVNYSLKNTFEDCGINYNYMQCSYEPGIIGDKNYPECDVLFMGNCYSQGRKDLANFLKSLPYNVKIYGTGYDEGISEGGTTYNFEENGNIIRSSKIVIGDSQFPDAEGFVSDRLFSSLAAGGAMLLHQTVAGMGELIGFQHGTHYVSWTDFEDLKEKLDDYLKDDYRETIAKQGTEYCREYHSFDNRVEELMNVLKTIKTKKKTISAALICKDEIDEVQRVIDQLSWCDEIVITDTGSTDGTLELLRELESDRIKIHEYKWDDNFAEARNYSKHQCTSEWIFWCDFDDYLDKPSQKALGNFFEWDLSKYGVFNAIAHQFPCKDSHSGQQVMQTRLFRRLSSIYWESKIHETVDESIEALGVYPNPLRNVDAIPVVIMHKGNESEEKRRNKQLKYLDILQKEPETADKYMGIAASYCALGQWANAILLYELLLDDNYFDFKNDQKSKDFKSYVWFALGYAWYHIPGGALYERKAVECFKKSDHVDAYFCLGDIQKDDAMMYKFIRGVMPVDYPSFKGLWLPVAKQKLANMYRERLSKLT